MLGAVEVFSADWKRGFPVPFLPKIGEVADSTSKHVLWLDAWGCLFLMLPWPLPKMVNCQSNEGLKDLMKDFIYLYCFIDTLHRPFDSQDGKRAQWTCHEKTCSDSIWVWHKNYFWGPLRCNWRKRLVHAIQKLGWNQILVPVRWPLADFGRAEQSWRGRTWTTRFMTIGP